MSEKFVSRFEVAMEKMKARFPEIGADESFYELQSANAKLSEMILEEQRAKAAAEQTEDSNEKNKN